MTTARPRAGSSPYAHISKECAGFAAGLAGGGGVCEIRILTKRAALRAARWTVRPWRSKSPPSAAIVTTPDKEGRPGRRRGLWPASGVTRAGFDPRSAVEGGWCRRVPAVPGPLLGPASHRTSGAGLDAVAAAPVGRCPFSRNPSRPFPRSRRERGPKPKTSGLDS